MSLITSQITSLTTVYSTAYSDADQRKHQSPASLAFVRGIHRGPVNSPHKGLVTRKMFPLDDVTMFVDGTTRFHTKRNPGRWLTLETISSGLHMLSSRHFYCEYAQRIWRNSFGGVLEVCDKFINDMLLIMIVIMIIMMMIIMMIMTTTTTTTMMINWSYRAKWAVWWMLDLKTFSSLPQPFGNRSLSGVFSETARGVMYISTRFFSFYEYWHGTFVKITEMYWEVFVLLICKVL